MGSDHHRLRGAHLALVAASTTANGGVMHPYLVTALVLAATWDAWRWYVLRVWDSPEEAVSLVLTIVFLGALGVARRRNRAMALPLVNVALLLGGFSVVFHPVHGGARAVPGARDRLQCAAGHQPVLCRGRARPACPGVVARGHRPRRLHAVGRRHAVAAHAAARPGGCAMRRLKARG